jgi:hypothetical protein
MTRARARFFNGREIQPGEKDHLANELAQFG